MKILIALCVLIALTCAEIATSNKYEGLHHSEHEKSVGAARQSMADRLSKLESRTGYGANQAHYGNTYGSIGSEKYVTGCSACIGGSENLASYNSRQSSSSQRSSSSSGHGLSSLDYAGVGIVGRVDDSDDDVQTVVAPGGYSGSSSKYSSNAFEASESQQRVVPADLSHVSSSAYRAVGTERDEDDLQRNVGAVYVGDSLRAYSQRQGDYEDEEDDVQRTVSSSGYVSGSTRSHSQNIGSESTRVSSVVPAYVSSGSQRTSSSQSQLQTEISDSRRPVPVGQHISISARPGTSTVLAVPVRVIQTTGVQTVGDDLQQVQSRTSEYSSGSEAASSSVQHPTSTTYRVVYTPVRNYVQQPEKLTNYNSFNAIESGSQSRFRSEDDSQSQVRVAPVSVSYPINGGSSRVASAGTSGSNYNYARVSGLPSTTYDSQSASSRTAEEREQRRYTPAVPTYIQSSRVASTDSDQSASQTQIGSTGTYVVPVGGQTRYQTQSQSGSGSQTQFQRTGGVGGSFTPYGPSSRNQYSQTSGSASSDRLSQRFGTGVSATGQIDDLQSYMSESERLARLQQQQISGSSGSVSLSNLDANRRTINNAANLDSTAANFVRSNLASRNSDFDAASADGAAGAGYNRVRSWNRQSKWSSGSEYGTDGKPKSYSTLSTAEGEKYNINGAETGYKAATTTLENDGKVSTYSIHTP